MVYHSDSEYELKPLGFLWIVSFLVFFTILRMVIGISYAILKRLFGDFSQNFWPKIGKVKTKRIWLYSVLVAAILAIFSSLFILAEALDPSHYHGEFCTGPRAANCENDILEIATFTGFWFVLSFIVLFIPLIWFWLNEKT
jgi:hypothetical protein